MLFKEPKNDEKYFWTEHSKFKMKQYGLGEQRIKRVLRNAFRKEEGIVKKTIAVMQPVSTKRVAGKETWKQEIWAMYQLCKSESISNSKLQIPNSRYKIISVWRYPGVSPKNNPIPEDILEEISELC